MGLSCGAELWGWAVGLGCGAQLWGFTMGDAMGLSYEVGLWG